MSRLWPLGHAGLCSLCHCRHSCFYTIATPLKLLCCVQYKNTFKGWPISLTYAAIHFVCCNTLCMLQYTLDVLKVTCMHACSQYHQGCIQYVKRCGYLEHIDKTLIVDMELSELNLIPKHGLVQTAKHAATMSGLHQSRVQTPVSCACIDRAGAQTMDGDLRRKFFCSFLNLNANL